MTGIDFLTFKIPFKSNFKTSNNIFHSRKGVIIKLKKDNFTALGEASPLPGFSSETMDNLTVQIQQNRSKFSNFFESDFTLEDLNDFLNQSSLSPSLQFGLFTAGTFYLSQKSEQSPQTFLFDNSSNSVKMNAVIDLKKRSLLPQARQYINRGFETIKIKAGNNWSELYPQIQKIRDEYEDISIRLDANRSWRADDAAERLKQVEELEIEYCEEPLRNITIPKLAQLKKETSIPIAIDEVMTRWPDIKELALAADLFIIKPMLIGNYSKIVKICAFAEENNKQVVFTSTLGTAVERLATAALASGLGSKSLAHGLNTGHFFSDDVWDDAPHIENGFYQLPDYNRLQELMQSDLKSLKLSPL